MNTQDLLKKYPVKMTCAQVMHEIRKSHVYVTRMAGQGRLVGHKEPMPGRKTEQWVFKTNDIIAWRKSVEVNTSPKTRFEISGVSEHEQDLQDLLKSAKPADIAALRKSLATLE